MEFIAEFCQNHNGDFNILKDMGTMFDERNGLQNPKFFLDGLKEKITN